MINKIKKVGFCGLGKLGLPVATCIDMKGFDVMGYDIDPSRMSKEPQPYRERGPDGTRNFNDWLATSQLKFGTLEEMVEHSDLIFVATQTPHDPRYEGITKLPEERKDFDYTYLKTAIKKIAECVKEDKIIAIICTCLPGTMEREVKSLLNDHMKLVYNPFFIAMGTTMFDFLHTEFVLLGVDDEEAAEKVEEFYKSFIHTPIKKMSIASAECTKVFYNTHITAKICLANAVGRICHDTPRANADDVMGALKAATGRIVSPLYMSPGMGDGGGCHPRDNIALSFVAREYGWKYDPWGDLMNWRQGYAEWLAEMMLEKGQEWKIDKYVILGIAFKPETNLVVGSPALLVSNILREKGIPHYLVDHEVTTSTISSDPGEEASVFLIGCKHSIYSESKFPAGSVVIDPHRYIPDQQGVEVIRIGEGK